MADIKGTRTEKNLLAAFAGESQARNRYTYFGSQARKDGFVQIADIFEETANQEKEHAKRFFSMLKGGRCGDNGGLSCGSSGDDAGEFACGGRGRKPRVGDAVSEFCGGSEGGGIPAVARLFEMISVAEKQHEKRYADLANNVEAGRVFKRDEPQLWRCRNCGYLHEGKEAPGACPACAHPQAHFEILGENW